jgi:hypothetical protein
VADLIKEVITIGEILRDPHFAWGVLGGSAFVGLLVRAVPAIRIRENAHIRENASKGSAKKGGR